MGTLRPGWSVPTPFLFAPLFGEVERGGKKSGQGAPARTAGRPLSMDRRRSVHVVTFGELLEKRKDTIVERWVDAVLSAYPSESAALFQAQRDPFANPLGHSVREGTRGIFQTILDGMDQEDLRTHLDKIVRIRAIQQLTPSEALSFVFSLRSIVRELIPEAVADARYREDLAEMDRKIDGVALAAFDLYAARREEVSQLRINEVKRQVAWAFGKKASTDDNVQREDLG